MIGIHDFVFLEITAFNLPIAVGFGIAFIHVISGPDHLAAVAPLVVETQKRHWKIGFMWGIGHVLGMTLIGVLYLFFKELIPTELISAYSEQLVGIILILLGLWSFYRIKSPKTAHSHPHVHQGTKEYVHIHQHQHAPQTNHQHPHSSEPKTNYFTAIIVGIIHGFAGVSHFILFSPVLAYHSNIDGINYIIGFALGTIFSMSLFAYLLGLISSHSKKETSKKLFTGIRWATGILAILIGVYWLIN